MTEEVIRLESPIEVLKTPIDVQHLIHKAFRVQGWRVRDLVKDFHEGDTLQPIRVEFNTWAAALLFHAQQEDKYMTAPLVNFQPARDNEEEHAQLEKILGDLTAYLEQDDTRGLAERVKEAMLALHERQHEKLMEKLEGVMAVLNQEIGKGRPIGRTLRHLFGRVTELRIAQYDHFEDEVAFVLPTVAERFNEAEQLELAKHLLIDEEAEDQRWFLDFVTQALSPGERQPLAALEAQFATTSTTAD